MGNVPDRNPVVITTGTSIVLGNPNTVIHLAPIAPTAALALVATAASPPNDGDICDIMDEVGAAHTITFDQASPPFSCLNGGLSGHKRLTFNGTVGSSVRLLCRNGSWWTEVLNGVSIS